MLRFAKAHAYGNDFLYVRAQDVGVDVAVDALARNSASVRSAPAPTA
jgi:hypothetical protein